MSAVTVVCVWVRGNVPYTADYVWRLRSMVARHLPAQHDFLVLTDRPKELIGPPPASLRLRNDASFGILRIANVEGLAGWWAKVQLFNPNLPIHTERVLYLDLDSVVVDDLRPIVQYSAPFALVPPGGSFQGKDGLAVVRRFNSSVMVWDRHAARRVWDAWSPAIAQRLHGDQDHIGEVMPEAGVMPASWFPRLSELGGQPPGPDAKVVLAKVPKNHIAAGRLAWFREAWR